MSQEPLISKTPTGLGILLSLMLPIFATLGWVIDKVITLDERVAEVYARQDRFREISGKWVDRAIELDESVVRNTTTLELLHERLDRLENMQIRSNKLNVNEMWHRAVQQ